MMDAVDTDLETLARDVDACCRTRGLFTGTGLPALFVRKEAKAYGTRRQAEGGDPEGRTVVLVEDVITTGGAVIDAATALRGLGARVQVVVCAIDRRPADATRLAEAGIEVRAGLTRADLDAAHG